ncbi:ferredoxin--NADP reductase [Vogesella sp. LIG4]|uniref:ferredoxin--NADP reductase n=1 Tax=Vogesella sp. LIG4 TaxID=1192162 RepID=UPI000820224E|nr:ferredoxin--NADP reductase [Vogesella sp. LIG4]SCK09507.1 ferredoxin--NADP+ reductase [Vogesella sp. LIG4]
MSETITAPATQQDDKFSAERISWLHRWHDKLFSFRLTRPEGFRFTPGQFARLGHALPDGGHVWRAYSMVSAPWDDYLEFYSIVVPGGQFTSRLAQQGVGDSVLLERKATGFFTADRLPDGEQLWLLATGTGLAPYLSILLQEDVWQRFEHIVLVHCVREVGELAYREEIAALREHPLHGDAYAHKLQYLPVVTREQVPGCLHERIPALLASGELAAAAGLVIDPEVSRFMICGNPRMVKDTYAQLQQMGCRLARLAAPGQVVLENGW